MRKALGLLFATSLLIPVGVIAASPAGSAAKGPTCKTLTATADVQARVADRREQDKL